MSENEEEIQREIPQVGEEGGSQFGKQAVDFREELKRRMIEAQKNKTSEAVILSESLDDTDLGNTNELGAALRTDEAAKEIEEAYDLLQDFSQDHEDKPSTLEETLLGGPGGATRAHMVEDTATRILASGIKFLNNDVETPANNDVETPALLGTALENNGLELKYLADSTLEISKAIASVASGEARDLSELNRAVSDYREAVVDAQTDLKNKGKERVWDMLSNRFKNVFGVGNGELGSVKKVDKDKPVEPETFLERVANTLEVAKRYRSRFNMMFDVAKAAGYEEEHASVDLKKRLAKETLFLLSLRNPLQSVNRLQDIFFAQRKGAPGRDPEGTPIAEKDKVMSYSESSSFFKYGELGKRYGEAIESRGGVSKTEQTAYAIRSMLELAATDKKDKYHILPEKKMFNVWGKKQSEGRDVTFVIFHRDAPYRLSIPVEKGGELPSVDAIMSSLSFLDNEQRPDHAISRNDKIKLRRLAYSRGKKESSVVKSLGKADFSIILDENSYRSVDERRKSLNLGDSLALTYGRETKACMVLQFDGSSGQSIARGIDMKFSHPWFNGKDAAETQFDIAMRMTARAQGRVLNGEGANIPPEIRKVNIKQEIVGQKEAEYWKTEDHELVAINREAVNWIAISPENIREINERIGALKKKGIPMTFGVLSAYAQGIGVGSEAFHQTYHSERTDELDIAIGVLPKISARLFDEYLRQGGDSRALRMAMPNESLDFKQRMGRLLGIYDGERKNTLDNRSSASTMAATAGVLEGVMKPMAEFLTGDMKDWVANPGTMNSMLLSGFDKKNPNADLGEAQRRAGVGNMDTYKRLGFEGHTTDYLVPQGFDTAQTASYLHGKGRGVMGGSEMYVADTADGAGVESRGVMLSMRVDLEQSTVEVASVLSSFVDEKRLNVEKRVVKANLEINMVNLSKILNDPNVSPVQIDQFVAKMAQGLGFTAEDLATKINASMRMVATRRAGRVQAAMNFVLDMLEA